MKRHETEPIMRRSKTVFLKLKQGKENGGPGNNGKATSDFRACDSEVDLNQSRVIGLWSRHGHIGLT